MQEDKNIFTLFFIFCQNLLYAYENKCNIISSRFVATCLRLGIANSVDPQYDSKPLFLKWSAQRAANYENTYSTRIRLFKVRITLPGVNVNFKKFFRALQRVFVNFSH